MATMDDVISVQQSATKNLGLIYQALLNGPPAWKPAPASSTSPGIAGQVAYDGTHLYVAVGTNAWGRVNLTTVF